VRCAPGGVVAPPVRHRPAVAFGLPPLAREGGEVMRDVRMLVAALLVPMFVLVGVSTAVWLLLRL
jgi:hypothetical protein